VLLSKVRGLEVREMNNADVCCGFGGSFAVKHESISVGMAEQKVAAAEEAGADYLISTDMSCLMHIEGYIKRQQKPMKVIHLIDALAEGWD